MEMNINATPPKRSKHLSDNTPKASLVSTGMPPVEDLTPRPTLVALTTATTFLPGDAPSRAGHSTTTTNTTDSSTDASNAGRKRKRDGSPGKSLVMLKRAEYFVEQRPIGRTKDLPEQLQPLAKAMRDIGCARGIIPTELAAELVPDLAEDEEDGLSLVSITRRQLGSLPTPPFVQRHLHHVAGNVSLARSEAAWNCNAHAPLLDEAWWHSRHRHSLRWENITTAAIEPKELLPALTASDTFASKKVDFAVTLVLDAVIERRLSRCGLTSLSQTTFEPLRYSPVAVSFETKLPGESWADANLQLNTWALAQVAKLKELLIKAGRPAVVIPALPLVVVQGNEWKFLYLEVGPKQAWLWTKISLGDTDCARGVYQVIAALQQLMEWSESVYRPWFMQNILIPILATVPNEI